MTASGALVSSTCLRKESQLVNARKQGGSVCAGANAMKPAVLKTDTCDKLPCHASKASMRLF